MNIIDVALVVGVVADKMFPVMALQQVCRKNQVPPGMNARL